MADLTVEAVAAFWAKVEQRSTQQDTWGHESCWPWLGPSWNDFGLYYFEADGRRRTVYAHQTAYFLRVGELPKGQRLFRLCVSDVVCVNPSHWGLKPRPRSGNEEQRSTPASQPPLPGKDPLFSQADLRNIRAAAGRVALGRDVAEVEDRQLGPAEAYLVGLAERVLAVLPEDKMGNYHLVEPTTTGEPSAAPAPVGDPVAQRKCCLRRR